MTATSSPHASTAHKRPNYIMIWLYLFVLTVAEVALAFELPVSRNVKLLLLLFLAVWKPLPSGRLTTRAAIWFASAITAGGVVYLGVTVNLLTAALAALTFASYVLLYTPLKRKTSLNTLVGAVPGALPIVGGWTAAGGSLGAAVAALFWILFLWQLPHFLALAWLYREDYRASGLRMLSVADDDGRETGRMALLYAMALLPISLLPTLLGVTGAWYFFGALVLGIGYVAAGTGLLVAATPARAWRLFFVSILYLPALLTLMVVDKVAA